MSLSGSRVGLRSPKITEFSRSVIKWYVIILIGMNMMNTACARSFQAG